MKKALIDPDILRELYVAKALGSVKIAEKLGVSSTTILKALKEYKISRPSLLCDDKEWLRNQYITLNKSCKLIAKENNLKTHTVLSRIKKFKIKKDDDKRTEAAKEARRKTNLNKFGFENPFQNEEVKESIRQTFLESYGVDHPMKNPEHKSRVESTNLKKYGAKTALLSSDFRQKADETNLQKYGTIIPQQSDLVKERICKTNLEKYGVEHFYQSDKFKASAKETNLERYGYSNPMLNSEVKKKAVDNRIKNNSTEISRKLNSPGAHKLIFGIPAFEVAKRNKIPYNTFNQWLNRRGELLTKEALRAYLDGYKSNETSIELILSEALDLSRHNKKFDKKLYPELNYKPDFKITDKVAVNVDGLYWHSEKFKNNKYHFKMRKDFEDLGLQLLQFREDEVLNKLEIVKSVLSAKSDKLSDRLFARKLKTIEVSNDAAKSFLNETHLKGHLDAKHIGLADGDELVMVMSYKVYSSALKIERLSCRLNTVVTGGFSKLLKFLERKLTNTINSVEYWVDLRYGTGNFLNNLGFVMERETLGFEWTDTYSTYNRLRCTANNNGNGKTEAESAAELGWTKIYDAGQRLYKKELR